MAKKIKKQRKLIKVRLGKNGVPTHYLIEGNKRVTPVEIVARMAKKGLIKDAHNYGLNHVRSDPDEKVKNNLLNLPRC